LVVLDDPAENLFGKTFFDAMMLSAVFTDGSSKVFTRDSRTTWIVSDPTAVEIIPTNNDGVRIIALTNTPTTVDVHAEALGMQSNIITFVLVASDRLETTVSSTEQRISGSQTTTLFRVHCSSLFQGLATHTDIVMSNSERVTIPPSTPNLYANEYDDKVQHVLPNEFIGKYPGTSTVTTTYGPLETTTLITVHTDSVWITEWDTTNGPSTFKGPVDSEMVCTPLHHTLV
jgi:hypothetical protein